MTLLCKAQFVNTQSIGSSTTLYKSKGGLGADSAMVWLNSFADTTAENFSVVSRYNSIIRVGTSFWYRTLNPNKWNQFTSGASGLYLLVADTAAMLANRLKISDTDTMLSSFVQYSDTANQMSGYLRKNFALLLQDTATAFSVRPLNNRFLDSISSLRVLANSKYTGGTVVSVATNSGTGLSGGTITSTGTLLIDTLNISTRLWRQKGIDSVVGLVSSKLNISDSLTGGYTTWLLTKKKVDSLGALIPSISGTTNYITKYASATTLGTSLLYDNGVGVALGTTSLIASLTISGTTYTSLASHTYTSGTEYALGVVNNSTFSGTLPTSNASFSTMPVEWHPTFSGVTTVNGNTPFGGSLFSAFSKFSGVGTDSLIMSASSGGIKAASAIIAGTFDEGSVNGRITNSAGIMINGIFKVSGSTATIGRTNHYQLLVNSSDEFGNGGNITNKYGVYQQGTADTNVFNGSFMLPNLPVYADNTAAASLATGTLYRTATGEVRVKY